MRAAHRQASRSPWSLTTTPQLEQRAGCHGTSLRPAGPLLTTTRDMEETVLALFGMLYLGAGVLLVVAAAQQKADQVAATWRAVRAHHGRIYTLAVTLAAAALCTLLVPASLAYEWVGDIRTRRTAVRDA